MLQLFTSAAAQTLHYSHGDKINHFSAWLLRLFCAVKEEASGHEGKTSLEAAVKTKSLRYAEYRRVSSQVITSCQSHLISLQVGAP